MPRGPLFYYLKLEGKQAVRTAGAFESAAVCANYFCPSPLRAGAY